MWNDGIDMGECHGLFIWRYEQLTYRGTRLKPFRGHSLHWYKGAGTEITFDVSHGETHRLCR